MNKNNYGYLPIIYSGKIYPLAVICELIAVCYTPSSNRQFKTG